MDSELYPRLAQKVSDYVANYGTKPNVLFLNEYLDPSIYSSLLERKVKGWIFDDILVIRFMDQYVTSQFFECRDLTYAVSYMIGNKIISDYFTVHKDLKPQMSYEYSSLPPKNLSTFKVINIPTRIIEIFKNYIQADPYLIYKINERRYDY